MVAIGERRGNQLALWKKKKKMWWLDSAQSLRKFQK